MGEQVYFHSKVYFLSCTAAGAAAALADGASVNCTPVSERAGRIIQLQVDSVSAADTIVYFYDYDGSSDVLIWQTTVDVEGLGPTKVWGGGHFLPLPAGHTLRAKSATGNAIVSAIVSCI